MDSDSKVSVFRAPPGSREPRFQREHFDLLTSDYHKRVNEAVSSEIGWIVGEIPTYNPTHIHESLLQKEGGEYFPYDGQIAVGNKNPEINFPHELLHWLSRHRTIKHRHSDSDNLGERVLGLRVRDHTSQEGLGWLSEAVISETTQRVLTGAKVLPKSRIVYGDRLPKEAGFINRYVGGWRDESIRNYTRRLGDSFGNNQYSEDFGSLLRPLVNRLRLYLDSSQGLEHFEKLKIRFPQFPKIDRNNEDRGSEFAFKILQIGEFGLDNSIVFQMINGALGWGQLKALVDISKGYDIQCRLKHIGDKRFDQDRFDSSRAGITKILSTGR